MMPLHDYEIEKLVLATLMISKYGLDDIGDLLTEECFFDPKNREIFSAIKSLVEEGIYPDMMLVGNKLSSNGSSISSLDIISICENIPQIIDIQPYILILQQYSQRRRLWEIGMNLMSQSVDLSVDINKLQNESKERLENLYGDGAERLETLQSSYKRLQEQMLVNMNMPEGTIRGTRTGFSQIDEKGGLCGGDLLIIGAETSQGKTSFATALSMSAIEDGDRVAFYSLEMTSLQLTARIASMKSGIPSTKILNQRMTIEEIYAVDRAMEKFDTSLMFFDERSTSSLNSVLLSIRMMVAKHGIKGAVVDYLQLINSKDEKLNVEQMTAKCARDLKNLAKELGIWIIAISQLSRNPQNPVPSMSRLRNSGQIEEASDIVLLIYRPRDNAKYPQPFTDIQTEGTAYVNLAKGRNIGTGEFICGFKSENTLFYPLSDYEITQLRMENSLPNTSKSMENDIFPF